MSQKNIIFFILIGAVFIASLLFFSNNTDEPISLENNLIPEQSITHGHGLAVDVADPNKLWIATHHGLLLFQDEKNLYRVGKSKDDYMGFSVHPTDPKVFFTSGHPSSGGNLGFQKSEDGGFTWKKVTDGTNGPVDFHAMAVSPVNSNIVYGWYTGNLHKSEDQGKNWEIVNREIAPIQLSADSVHENKLYATTRSGVLTSNDKGITWTMLSEQLATGAVTAIAIHPDNSQILLVFSEALRGLGKSTDGGQNWVQIDDQFSNEMVTYIAFSSIEPDTVYALTQKNKLFKSSDTGDSWIQIR